MTRRTRWMTGGAVALIAVGLAAAGWWALARPHPCRAAFERVRAGMTRAEVEATVGRPPGDHTGGRALTRFAVADGWAPRPGAVSWVAADGELMVWFGPDGTAEEVAIEPVAYLSPTLFERLLARLGL